MLAEVVLFISFLKCPQWVFLTVLRLSHQITYLPFAIRTSLLRSVIINTFLLLLRIKVNSSVFPLSNKNSSWLIIGKITLVKAGADPQSSDILWKLHFKSLPVIMLWGPQLRNLSGCLLFASRQCDLKFSLLLSPQPHTIHRRAPSHPPHPQLSPWLSSFLHENFAHLERFLKYLHKMQYTGLAIWILWSHLTEHKC